MGDSQFRGNNQRAEAGMAERAVSIDITLGVSVSGTLIVPQCAFACLVLAHGAGAGMHHPFMTAIAEGLAAAGIATLRYQFPYMERGAKRPDRPELAQATVRAAAAAANHLVGGLPLLAGGKSFGGRMTSQAQAEEALPAVAGLVFLGFPLHPAGSPSDARARHLARITVPMLFLQGTRDALAEPMLLRATLESLPVATVRFFEGADHAFHVRARSGQTDQELWGAMVEVIAGWARDAVR
jgi:predicted alpha/beta-hydrolase family hydrolase